MKVFQRILCPTDFSDAATRAFRYADKLAHAMDAELLLLHVFELAEVFDLQGQEDHVDPEIRSHLDSFRSSFADARLEHVLRAGQPGEVICALAHKRGCDLIVIGTRGRTGLARLLRGSVADYVLHHARCPVLAFPPHEERGEGGRV